MQNEYFLIILQLLLYHFNKKNIKFIDTLYFLGYILNI